MEISSLKDGEEVKVELRKNEDYPFSIEEFERGLIDKILEQRTREGQNRGIMIIVTDDPLKMEEYLTNPNNRVVNVHNTCADNGRTLCAHFSANGIEHVVALYGYQKVYTADILAYERLKS